MMATTSILIAVGAFAGAFVGAKLASAKGRPAPTLAKTKADFSGAARRLGPGEDVLMPGPVTIHTFEPSRVQISRRGNVIDVVILPFASNGSEPVG